MGVFNYRRSSKDKNAFTGTPPSKPEPKVELKAPEEVHALAMEYGMWVMPIDVFLGMDSLQAHQRLKRDGKLLEYSPELKRPVFFLSHQWLSFKHPDPLMEQVKTFQELLRNLGTGTMDVPLSFLHKCSFDVVPTMTGEFWKEILPNAVVWMDFFSMPQPNQLDVEAVGTESDARHLSTDLMKAVRSIPAYVEASEYFFVLAPPAQHKDLENISDKESWARRGWCRMEAQARALSTKSGPIIMVSGASCAETMISAEWYRTPVGSGEFTCCKLGHKLETESGVVDIECDKIKVAQVLETMYNNKMTALRKQGRTHEWRWLLARRQTLFSNLPHEYATFVPYTVPAFLKEYEFASVTEGEESGWGPLRFAAIAKDGALVKELIAQKADVNNALPESALDLYHQKGQTVLQTAAVFGHLDVIEPLLTSGADTAPALGN
jgi:hypothetical protein